MACECLLGQLGRYVNEDIDEVFSDTFCRDKSNYVMTLLLGDLTGDFSNWVDCLSFLSWQEAVSVRILQRPHVNSSPMKANSLRVYRDHFST